MSPSLSPGIRRGRGARRVLHRAAFTLVPAGVAAVAGGRVPSQPDSEEWRRDEIAVLGKLAREVEADGVRFARVVIPPAIVRSEDPAECEGSRWRGPPGWCEWAARKVAFAKRVAAVRGIPVIDVTRCCAMQPDTDLSVHEGDPDHPNAFGHALIARAAARLAAAGPGGAP